MGNRILVVEDEEAISELICMNLSVAGYEPVPAFDGNQAEAILLQRGSFDLTLLDIMLPGKDGFALMDTMKRHQIPVIYLTARGDVASKIKGLKDGAEDYMVKPFEVLELLVRIEKVLKRTGKQRDILIVKDLKIHLKEHLVIKGENPVALKPLEYDLLVLFAENKNTVFTREQLLLQIWGCDYLGETRTVDVHIGQIRKKLDLFDVIQTIPKIGYRMEDSV